MANIKAAKKHVRTSSKRAMANKRRKSEIKTLVKNFELAIEDERLEDAQDLLKLIDKKVKKAVHKNIMHKNAGSRKISKLTLKLNKAM